VTRLRSDFWVAAHLRSCATAGLVGVLRRRGAAEAGAIFIKVDRLDGTASLYGPAPQALVEDAGVRRFTALLTDVPAYEVEERMAREARFDSDYWLIEVESRTGLHGLDLADESRQP
jgi:hypothetical protein